MNLPCVKPPHPRPLSDQPSLRFGRQSGEGNVLTWDLWLYSITRCPSYLQKYKNTNNNLNTNIQTIETQIPGATAPFPNLGKGRGWGGFVFVFRFLSPPIGEASPVKSTSWKASPYLTGQAQKVWPV